MLLEYVQQRLAQAKYKILKDGTYFGEIPTLPGVWADGKTLEECRETLREVVEDWIVVSLQEGDPVPGLQVGSKKRSKRLSHA